MERKSFYFDRLYPFQDDVVLMSTNSPAVVLIRRSSIQIEPKRWR